MRSTLKRNAFCDGKTIERYLAHLTMAPGEEVVPVGDLLPSPKEGPSELVKFHKLLVDRHRSEKNDVVGVQIHHPSNDVMRMLRATEPAAWPLFHSDINSSLEPLKRGARRISAVDSGIVLRLGSGDLAPGILVTHYCPSIVFSGSRYTYFAPHAIGLAADRNGLVTFTCCNKWTPWDRAVLDSSHVLLRGGEPVRIGNVRHCGIDVHAMLETAATCMRASVDRELREGDLILVAGFHARLPAGDGGKFQVNMGPFGGEVTATLS